MCSTYVRHLPPPFSRTLCGSVPPRGSIRSQNDQPHVRDPPACSMPRRTRHRPHGRRSSCRLPSNLRSGARSAPITEERPRQNGLLRRVREMRWRDSPGAGRWIRLAVRREAAAASCAEAPAAPVEAALITAACVRRRRVISHEPGQDRPASEQIDLRTMSVPSFTRHLPAAPRIGSAQTPRSTDSACDTMHSAEDRNTAPSVAGVRSSRPRPPFNTPNPRPRSDPGTSGRRCVPRKTTEPITSPPNQLVCTGGVGLDGNRHLGSLEFQRAIDGLGVLRASTPRRTGAFGWGRLTSRVKCDEAREGAPQEEGRPGRPPPVALHPPEEGAVLDWTRPELLWHIPDRGLGTYASVDPPWCPTRPNRWLCVQIYGCGSFRCLPHRQDAPGSMSSLRLSAIDPSLHHHTTHSASTATPATLAGLSTRSLAATRRWPLTGHRPLHAARVREPKPLASILQARPAYLNRRWTPLDPSLRPPLRPSFHRRPTVRSLRMYLPD